MWGTCTQLAAVAKHGVGAEVARGRSVSIEGARGGSILGSLDRKLNGTRMRAQVFRQTFVH